MTKFVGKFRKNKEYNDDYAYTHSKHRNEHAEIKKLLTQYEDEENETLEEELSETPEDELLEQKELEEGELPAEFEDE